jgi:HD-like signal output (HDOD) protein/DNA-binding CsgD family transcriptional regulator
MKVAASLDHCETAAPVRPVDRDRLEHPRRGMRLLQAFEAFEVFPALTESRDRLLADIGRTSAATAEIVASVESDVALTTTVLRLANDAQPGRGQIDTVAGAIKALSAEQIRTAVERMSTFGLFERADVWGTAPIHFRLHALATQRAADKIAAEIDYRHRDRLAVTSLLHDVGKLVLIHAYPGYPEDVHRTARTPGERILREARELWFDHALVGGVLIRRWGLPSSLASPIERHHDPEAEGDACIIRLADMIAHYEQGDAVSSQEMLQSAEVLGLKSSYLRQLIYGGGSSSSTRDRIADPCPLSPRESTVLRRLAAGGVAKQIAQDLGISPSVVRTHLHHIYRKLGVVDRAQAVLVANKRGWVD